MLRKTLHRSLLTALLVSSFFCFLLFLALGASLAQQTAETPAFDDAVQSGLSSGEKEEAELAAVWEKTREAIAANNLAEATDLIEDVRRRKVELGYRSLNQASFELLKVADREVSAGRRDSAAFFVRKAVELSPFSPEVLFKAVRPAQITGALTAGELLGRGFRELLSDRHAQIHLFQDYTYPLLWALTIAVYLIFAFLFLFELPDIMKILARLIPAGFRGVLTPLLTGALIIFPILLGPLWCLTGWALLCFACLPERRGLIFMTALCIAAWSIVLPLRENLHFRMADRGVQTILSVASGQYALGDLKTLKSVTVARPGDPLAWFYYAQMLRRAGAYPRALGALARADVLWHNSEPLVKAEKGIIAFLSGDSQQADRLYAELENEGMSSTPFYFNFSKVKFDLLDTEGSRGYFNKALRQNRALTETLKANEEALGLRNRNAIAEFSLPAVTLFSSLMQEMPGSAERHQQLMALVMPGAAQSLGVLVAVLLLVLALLPRSQKKIALSKKSTLYSDFRLPWPIKWLMRLVPGGAWVLVGRPASAVILLALAIACALPFADWPDNSRAILDYMPDILPYYAGFSALMVLGLIYVGYLLTSEE